MCGFVAAFWNTKNQPSFEQQGKEIHLALQSIKERGPDGLSIWQKDGVAMAHARLAFVSGHGETQPIQLTSRHIGMMNGEFYDYKKWDERKIGLSDCSVLLKKIIEKGTGFLNHVSFDGAGVIYDNEEKTVFMFRDLYGIKPLHYLTHLRGLFVGSKIKPFIQTGWSGMSYNQEALETILSEQYLEPEQTLFQNVLSVPAGGWVFFRKDKGYWKKESEGVWGSRSWRPREDPCFSNPVSKHDKVEKLDLLLNESVQKRIAQGGKIACHLSGGVDSSLILALGKKYLPNILAYTVCFEENNQDLQIYNEYLAAQKTAQHLGVKWNPIKLTLEECFDAWEEAMYHSEGVAINSHLAAKWLMHQKMKKDGIRAVLSGEGADELFLGYSHLTLEHQPSAFISNETSLLSSSMHTQPDLRSSLYIWQQSKAKNAKFLSDFLLPEWQQKIRSIKKIPPRKTHYLVHEAALAWIDRALHSYILMTLGDGTEACHGIEGRPPFLDSSIYHFTSQLLPEDCFSTKGKYILRKVAERYLPYDIAWKAKHPFEAPPLLSCSNTKQKIKTLITQYGLSIVNQEHIQPWFDELSLSEQIQHEPAVSLIVSLCFLEKFKQQHDFLLHPSVKEEDK